MFKNQKHSCLQVSLRFIFLSSLFCELFTWPESKLTNYLDINGKGKSNQIPFDCLSKAHLAYSMSRNWLPFPHRLPILWSPLPTQPDFKQSVSLSNCHWCHSIYQIKSDGPIQGPLTVGHTAHPALFPGSHACPTAVPQVKPAMLPSVLMPITTACFLHAQGRAGLPPWNWQPSELLFFWIYHL